MNIAIIGAGFTGLSASFRLSKRQHKVTLFEKDPSPGGLAIGYQEKNWKWTLEKHYHHWFTNDSSVLNLAKEINHKVFIKRPITSVYVDSILYRLDSPKNVLLFPKLPLIDRLRMATTLGLLRYNPIWKPLEKLHTDTFLKKTMGRKAYEMLWEPQLSNKFGEYVSDISLAWFWARIRKRTSSLAYPDGGFLNFANHLINVLNNRSCDILFNTEILKLESQKEKILVSFRQKSAVETVAFDRVIVTLPSFLFVKIAWQLPESYKQSLLNLKGIGAVNMVLRLKKKFFPNNTYWLSICDKTSPIMAIVEHTNFMDKKYYNNEHIVYVGNYVPQTHSYFLLDKKSLFDIYNPYLKKINPFYLDSLIGYEVFKAPFAQPIIPTNYSKILPSFETPLKNVYLANIQQVYPWDRGTNYAVELGEKVTRLIDET